MKIRKELLLVLILLMVVMFTISSSAKTLTIATDPMGTGTYGATSGIANVINKYNTIGLTLKVKPTTGSLETSGLLATGEAQIGVHNNFDSQFSWLTKGDFDVYHKIEKVTPLRLLFGGGPTFSSALTHSKAGIKNGADLKGKKFVGEYTSSPQDTAQGIAFLACWGLTKEDVIWMKVPGLTEAVNTLIEGTADAIGASGPGPASVNELEAKKGAQFLSINPTPEGVEAFRKAYPWEVDIVVVDPDPRLTGVKETLTMIKFDDYYMARVDKVTDDEAYAMVKAIYDNLVEVSKISSYLSFLTKPELLVSSKNTVPYHPGVIKFYKEKGLWNQAFEDRNTYLLGLEAEELKR